MNIQNAIKVNINPPRLLEPDIRKISYDLHFVAV